MTTLNASGKMTIIPTKKSDLPRKSGLSIHPASKAGSWYPSSPIELRESLQFCEVLYVNERSIRAKSDDRKNSSLVKGKVLAGVVPHAGMIFSGVPASAVFYEIAHSFPAVKTVVIFGAVHTMPITRPAIWATGAWQSPLGACEIDTELARRVIVANLADDYLDPHLGDNAIEMQIPYIKYHLPQAEILPIAVPPLRDSADFGKKFAELAADLVDEIVVIASADFTHYGENYGFTPFGVGEKALLQCKKNDLHLLELVAGFASDKILAQAEKDRSSCGAGALAAVSAYAEKINADSGELLMLTTSYEAMPPAERESEPTNFVDYAAMVFREPVKP